MTNATNAKSVAIAPNAPSATDLASVFAAAYAEGKAEGQFDKLNAATAAIVKRIGTSDAVRDEYKFGRMAAVFFPGIGADKASARIKAAWNVKPAERVESVKAAENAARQAWFRLLRKHEIETHETRGGDRKSEKNAAKAAASVTAVTKGADGVERQQVTGEIVQAPIPVAEPTREALVAFVQQQAATMLAMLNKLNVATKKPAENADVAAVIGEFHKSAMKLKAKRIG